MDDGTWNRLKEIFHEAAEKPLGERTKLLDDACAGNVAMRAEIEELLRVHDRTDPCETAGPEVVEGPGTMVGRYKILEKIGEGGFGVVYMAEETEPLRRRVALKVIRPGMGTRQVMARFEVERQALAMMDHPNIAKVLDAGSTGGEEGRPYFVMELVRGIPITQYCDQSSLTLRQRLELFLSACQAVQHAHQKGIIHRDIKPSNVLTAMQNGHPVVKVIDFGVAKAMNQRLTEQTLLTGFAQMLGTPLYMSPEQAEMSPLEVDTRSDIYSLGVLLYELLTGTTPFEKERLGKASFDELRRIIREEETPPPSIRLSTLGDRTTRVAEQRRTVPEKLRQLVRGDLDWIVMKALEKDRARRYETADGLARDIERHLSDEPVEARPPSAGYKFRKFVRRNKLALTTMGLVAAALLIGAGVSAWQAVRATRAKAEANAHAQKAETEAAIARAANEFIDDLLSQADPNKEPDRHLELRTVLDRAAEKIKGRFEAQPLVEASVRSTLGRTYMALGEYDKAEQHLERAREVYLAEEGPENPRTLGSTSNLAVVYLHQGRHPEAEKLQVQVLEVQRRVLGSEHRDTLGSMSNLAFVRGPEAERLHAQVLEVRRRVLGPEHPDTLSSMSNLAEVYRHQARYPEAEKLQAQVLEINIRVRGPEHLATLGSMSNLAVVYSLQGRYLDAEKLCQEVLEVRRRVLGPEHPDTLDSKMILANGYNSQGRNSEAERLHQEVLEVRRRVSGAEHPRTLMSMNNLACVYERQGRDSDAEKLYQEVLEVHRRVLGPEHPDTLSSMSNVALAYSHQGRYSDAEKLQTQVLEVRRRVLRPEHPDTLASMNNLAEVYREQARYPEAEKLQAQVLEISSRILGPEHPDTLAGMNNLAVVYCFQNRYSDGEKLHAQVLEARRRILGPEHPDTLASMSSLALVYYCQERDSEAEKLQAQALEVQRRVLGPEHPNTLMSMNNLAAVYYFQNRYPEAERLHAQVLEVRRRVLGPEHPETLASMSNLALVHGKLGRVEDAIKLHEQTLHLRRTVLGPGHPQVLQSVENVADSYNDLAWRAVASADPVERNPTRAVELARKALELTPKDGDIWNTLGVAQYRGGQWREAIAALEKSVELSEGGGSAFDYFFLAMAHWELASGQAGESASSRALARQWYERAVEWMARNAAEDEELKRFRAEAAELLGMSAPPEPAARDVVPETDK